MLSGPVSKLHEFELTFENTYRVLYSKTPVDGEGERNAEKKYGVRSQLVTGALNRQDGCTCHVMVC